jgi:hypothetical protein
MYVHLQMYSMFQLTVNRNENFLKWPTISSRIFFSCLIKSTREHYAYCKYCKQDLSIQHGGRDEHTYTTKQFKSGIEQEMDRSFSTIDSPENP